MDDQSALGPTTRIAGTILELNRFRIDLNGKTREEVRSFVNGVHSDLAMLAEQFRNDRIRLLRAQGIDRRATRLLARLHLLQPGEIREELTEIQSELTAFLMVLENLPRSA